MNHIFWSPLVFCTWFIFFQRTHNGCILNRFDFPIIFTYFELICLFCIISHNSQSYALEKSQIFPERHKTIKISMKTRRLTFCLPVYILFLFNSGPQRSSSHSLSLTSKNFTPLLIHNTSIISALIYLCSDEAGFHIQIWPPLFWASTAVTLEAEYKLVTLFSTFFAPWDDTLLEDRGCVQNYKLCITFSLLTKFPTVSWAFETRMLKHNFPKVIPIYALGTRERHEKLIWYIICFSHAIRWEIT